MDNVYQYIVDLFVGNGLIIAVATFVIGMIIKQSIKKVPNDIIPLIGGVIGILLGIFIPDIFPGKDILTSAICGLALGWASTGGYETVKNLISNKNTEE
jgi:Na+-translocating ferredoxin:NAD+ oxidoreductase RnfD subunit